MEALELVELLLLLLELLLTVLLLADPIEPAKFACDCIVLEVLAVCAVAPEDDELKWVVAWPAPLVADCPFDEQVVEETFLADSAALLRTIRLMLDTEGKLSSSQIRSD